MQTCTEVVRKIISSDHAFDGRVAELVDALDSKSSGSNTVRVQVPLRPPNA